MKLFLRGCLLLLASPMVIAADQAQVAPINWDRFKPGLAPGPDAERFGQILISANKYGLTTWWASRQFDHLAADGYLDLGGVTEHRIRPVAAEAQGLAVALKLGLYDGAQTGIAAEEAERRAIRLIRAVVHRHRATSPRGWGMAWQSPFWAASVALAGWLLWDHLDATTQAELVGMLEREASWVVSNKGERKIKTYRNSRGKIISPGDTGLEENAGDANVLYAATAMMPAHPMQGVWMRKAIELMLTAQARPGDLERGEVYHGRPLSQWLSGSNLNPDGTVVNHGLVHPDYMVAGLFESNPISFYSLAGRPVPRAGLFNDDVIYRALATLSFSPGAASEGKPVLPPGGTIYHPDSSYVYYPNGNDWGTGHRLNLAFADAITSAFSEDPELKRQAAVWEERHTTQVLRMQDRFADGRTYGAMNESTYPSREEWIADFASLACLLKWLVRHNAVGFSNQPF